MAPGSVTKGIHDRTTTPSPELSPLDIGEDFAPIRIPKPAGQASVDFSGLLNPPLLLHEDLKEGCGGQLWPAGIVLGRYLLERLELLHGKTIIELGAGGGLTGLGLALALQRTQQKPSLSTPLLITDLDILLPLQHQNIALNSIDASLIASAAFPWGGSIPSTVPSEYHHPDIILAADCVYFEPAFPLLLETLHELLNENKKLDAVCYFCMKKRRKADMRFISALKKKFVVGPLAFEAKDEEERNVYLYEVRRKTFRK